MMQDAYPMCAFSSGPARSSVLGVRPSALIRYRVSGPSSRVPGTRDKVHGSPFQGFFLKLQAALQWPWIRTGRSFLTLPPTDPGVRLPMVHSVNHCPRGGRRTRGLNSSALRCRTSVLLPDHFCQEASSSAMNS
jgi:hypothetical protein